VGDEKIGLPTAQSVNCVTKEPGVEVASLGMPAGGVLSGEKYQKFTSQEELGQFLVKHYKIRTPNELASCEVCHR
jgi:hypothetical protein